VVEEFVGIGSHQLFLINFINIDHVKKSHKKHIHKEEKMNNSIKYNNTITDIKKYKADPLESIKQWYYRRTGDQRSEKISIRLQEISQMEPKDQNKELNQIRDYYKEEIEITLSKLDNFNKFGDTPDDWINLLLCSDEEIYNKITELKDKDGFEKWVEDNELNKKIFNDIYNAITTDPYENIENKEKISSIIKDMKHNIILYINEVKNLDWSEKFAQQFFLTMLSFIVSVISSVISSVILKTMPSLLINFFESPIYEPSKNKDLNNEEMERMKTEAIEEINKWQTQLYIVNDLIRTIENDYEKQKKIIEETQYLDIILEDAKTKIEGCEKASYDISDILIRTVDGLTHEFGLQQIGRLENKKTTEIPDSTIIPDYKYETELTPYYMFFQTYTGSMFIADLIKTGSIPTIGQIIEFGTEVPSWARDIKAPYPNLFQDWKQQLGHFAFHGVSTMSIWLGIAKLGKNDDDVRIDYQKQLNQILDSTANRLNHLSETLYNDIKSRNENTASVCKTQFKEKYASLDPVYMFEATNITANPGYTYQNPQNLVAQCVEDRKSDIKQYIPKFTSEINGAPYCLTPDNGLETMFATTLTTTTKRIILSNTTGHVFGIQNPDTVTSTDIFYGFRFVNLEGRMKGQAYKNGGLGRIDLDADKVLQAGRFNDKYCLFQTERGNEETNSYTGAMGDSSLIAKSTAGEELCIPNGNNLQTCLQAIEINQLSNDRKDEIKDIYDSNPDRNARKIPNFELFRGISGIVSYDQQVNLTKIDGNNTQSIFTYPYTENSGYHFSKEVIKKLDQNCTVANHPNMTQFEESKFTFTPIKSEFKDNEFRHKSKSLGTMLSILGMDVISSFILMYCVHYLTKKFGNASIIETTFKHGQKDLKPEEYKALEIEIVV
tara:strand:- start:498 stop:3173 length:2676 start_codon:yes stop_codon:yes gene_type:complete